MLSDLIAQTTTTPGGLGDIIATYGPFAPFAALLLWLVRLLWEDNKSKEEEIRNLTETAMEKIIPLVLEATNVLSEAVDALQQVRDRQHNAQQLSEVMEELLVAMEELRQTIHRSQQKAASRKRAAPRKKAP